MNIIRPLYRCMILPTTLTCLAAASSAADRPVDFASQIKPLLSDRCFLCHGPAAETREADLRLDSHSGLTAPLASDDGRRAVVPGKPEASELVVRIGSPDLDVRMPPPDSGLSLTPAEQQLLIRWIDEGAKWQEHWAFEPIPSPAPPGGTDNDQSLSEIDRFIVSRLKDEGFSLNPRASREHLIRRATFDLTGLPPTLEEIDAFLADDSAEAFSKVLDRLLASEHYGERMAADWLDAARYSDTFGYQVDRDRFVWPWRDWVVRAFNSNMPWDRFITEQLAGDLLPAADRDQRLATTFNRLHPQKVEGGSTPEEFRVEYVADRTQTVATAFMGLTFECARCHDHKYDPITQREYYQLFSFFNNIDESGLYSYFTSSVPTPTLRLPTAEQETQLAQAATEVAIAEEKQTARRTQFQSEKAVGDFSHSIQKLLSEPELLIPDRLAFLNFDTGAYGPNQLVPSPHGQAVRLTGDHGIGVKVGNFARWQPFTISLWINTPELFERSVIFHRSRAWTDAGSRGYELLIEDGHLSAALIHFWPGNAVRVRSVQPLQVGRWTHVVMTWDGSSRAAGLRLWLDGQPAEVEVVRDNLYKNITGGGGDTITIGERFRDRGFTRGLVDEFQVFSRELTPLEIRHLYDGIALNRQFERIVSGDSTADRLAVRDYLAATQDPASQELRQTLQSCRETLCRMQDSLQEIMAMEERPAPRPAYVLNRGAYDQLGEPVSAEVPAFLPQRSPDMPANRLGLARWLTSDDHPLTARVAVNRFWQMCFGNGLVRTPEDFGSQGQSPTHPELLDWLAADFRTHGWNVKRLLKQMLMSSTYQQSSRTTFEQQRRDPENLLLSRATVYRLSAEMLRDNALAVSGLLQRKTGGPPVKPYELAASFKPSQPDKGDGLYRRSLYTYWKRTAPAPMMMTLDASTREVCRVKRERTASPLQTLVVMNGPQFVEAARMLADRLIEQYGNEENDILRDMFRLVTSRQPTESEQTVLRELLQAQQNHFEQNPDSTAAYLSVGDAHPKTTDSVRLAAWASVANALFAFDECMMRR